MDAHAQPDFPRMFEIVTSFWVARAVHAGTVLGLPDLVAEQSRTVDELAELTGTEPRSLYRLLRALTGVGVFRTDEQARYASTPLGDTLRSDLPGSLASFVQLELGDSHHATWGRLVESVRSGEPVFERAVSQPIWEFFESTPVMNEHLGKAMTGLTAMVADAVLDVYDFSPYRRIVDVGGGEGGFLTAILRAHPEVLGTVFDLPHVVANGRPRIAGAGLADRCEMVGGSFFEKVPEGGDLYTMKWVLHDWNDESSIEILKSCRRTMSDDARLLVVEAVVPDGDGFAPGKIIDLNMMVLSGGQERTPDEFQRLLAAAGFTLTRILPTRSPSSVIEAIPIPAT
ncbi:methyltransferase [Streptomyces sp. DG2A-72]|uniref:methyltransferase n=1 Tax=Streptomyces sp. DG2A-72 TaxID=3051386 RepID=UPI00265BB3EF|nr:methyltransferase [Streptomyces sp. DG2A-72]MDO0937302.1 methyltransferase [Streptomyces sp. DG2A-72]